MERCRNIKLSPAQWGYLINNSDLTKTSSSGLNALSSAIIHSYTIKFNENQWQKLIEACAHLSVPINQSHPLLMIAQSPHKITLSNKNLQLLIDKTDSQYFEESFLASMPIIISKINLTESVAEAIFKKINFNDNYSLIGGVLLAIIQSEQFNVAIKIVEKMGIEQCKIYLNDAKLYDNSYKKNNILFDKLGQLIETASIKNQINNNLAKNDKKTKNKI